MQERDHIGFDPIKWVDRLMDVAASSQFTEAEKSVIKDELARLRYKLMARC